MKKIKTALISVYHKEGLSPLLEVLHRHQCTFISTGGTANFIRKAGYEVIEVESLTGYPSILDGRVKTLHPAVFGGILARKNVQSDLETLKEYKIDKIDMVVVDLYPFEESVATGASHEDIIEKIDIGGISLIRAAAKNYSDVTCVPHREHYASITAELEVNQGSISSTTRLQMAVASFALSSYYDTAITNYLQSVSGEHQSLFRSAFNRSKKLRYGENPHQKAVFYGDLDEMFEQLHGKDISYNNLLDIDSAIQLILDLGEQQPAFAILKHNNACGVARRDELHQAYSDALAGDPVSAFGGVLVCNRKLDVETAEKMHSLFFEIILAPDYEEEALNILKQKKNRIILQTKKSGFENLPEYSYKTVLNGVLYQEKDTHIDSKKDFKVVTDKKPEQREIEDLLLASIISKNSKSNTIVLVKDGQLLASGVGQTSRIDALKHAIEKAKANRFDLENAVMASDAFFPFPDNVETAYNVGIRSVIQPGGSLRDQLSIDFCNEHDMAMVFTGYRHFRH